MYKYGFLTIKILPTSFLSSLSHAGEGRTELKDDVRALYDSSQADEPIINSYIPT